MFWLAGSGVCKLCALEKVFLHASLKETQNYQHGLADSSVERRQRITQWQAETKPLAYTAMNCADMEFSLPAAPSDEGHHEFHSTGGYSNPSAAGEKAPLPLVGTSQENKQCQQICHPLTHECPSFHRCHRWTSGQSHQKTSCSSSVSSYRLVTSAVNRMVY